MAEIMTTINSDDFKQDIAVEINGKEYDLPQRTAELDGKLSGVEKKRQSVSEYDFLSENMEIIFGKANAKEILKDGVKTNLDFLAKIYTVCIGLIYEEKIKAEKETTEKRLDELSPVLETLGKAQPLIEKVK